MSAHPIPAVRRRLPLDEVSGLRVGMHYSRDTLFSSRESLRSQIPFLNSHLYLNYVPAPRNPRVQMCLHSRDTSFIPSILYLYLALRQPPRPGNPLIHWRTTPSSKLSTPSSSLLFLNHKRNFYPYRAMQTEETAGLALDSLGYHSKSFARCPSAILTR